MLQRFICIEKSFNLFIWTKIDSWVAQVKFVSAGAQAVVVPALL